MKVKLNREERAIYDLILKVQWDIDDIHDAMCCIGPSEHYGPDDEDEMHELSLRQTQAFEERDRLSKLLAERTGLEVNPRFKGWEVRVFADDITVE